VDWADDANKDTGFGSVPSYIIGKFTYRIISEPKLLIEWPEC
jgi:hypothetical protein